jgi:uncharacterized Zn-binding protein involved in type VI secretion
MSNIGIVGSKLNAVGGLVTQGKDFCKVNGVAVAYVGSKGTTHVGPPPHVQGQWAVSTGSSFVKVEGIAIAKIGSKTSCNHTVTSGGFVNING